MNGEERKRETPLNSVFSTDACEKVSDIPSISEITRLIRNIPVIEKKVKMRSKRYLISDIVTLIAQYRKPLLPAKVTALWSRKPTFVELQKRHSRAGPNGGSRPNA